MLYVAELKALYKCEHGILQNMKDICKQKYVLVTHKKKDYNQSRKFLDSKLVLVPSWIVITLTSGLID